MQYRNSFTKFERIKLKKIGFNIDRILNDYQISKQIKKDGFDVIIFVDKCDNLYSYNEEYININDIQFIEFKSFDELINYLKN
jgi:hypothetical protein